RDAADKKLTALDALKIYALKTAPAFEAALYAGVRMAGPADAYEKLVVEFSRNLGVAFQILNDLKDWQGDVNKKLLAGQDALAARPTLLLALTLEAMSPEEGHELMKALAEPAANKLEWIHRRFADTGAFDKAEKLIDKYRTRAEAIADEATPTELRELLYYLIDTVLEPVQPLERLPSELVQLGV